MNVEFVDTRREHVVALVEIMRERERLAFAEAKLDPVETIFDEVLKSVICKAALADGQCAAIWGAKLPGVLGTHAYIWVVCSEMIEQYPVTFLRHSRKAIAELRQTVPHLHGLVLAEFEDSIKWLRWLGFTVAESTGPAREFYV